MQLQVTMISTFKCWYQIKLSRPLSQHTVIPGLVWLVSHVMLVTKTRVRLARWSQEKSGPIVMSDEGGNQAAPGRASRDIRLCPDPVLPLQSVTLGAEDQLLAAIILSGAVSCYGGVRPCWVRLCEVSPNNYARPAQSQSSRQIPSL